MREKWLSVSRRDGLIPAGAPGRAGDHVGHGTGKCAGPTLRSEDPGAMSEIFVAIIRRNRAGPIPQSKKYLIPASTAQL
jgi:hypothetical protein